MGAGDGLVVSPRGPGIFLQGLAVHGADGSALPGARSASTLGFLTLLVKLLYCSAACPHVIDKGLCRSLRTFLLASALPLLVRRYIF